VEKETPAKQRYVKPELILLDCAGRTDGKTSVAGVEINNGTIFYAPS